MNFNGPDYRVEMHTNDKNKVIGLTYIDMKYDLAVAVFNEGDRSHHVQFPIGGRPCLLNSCDYRGREQIKNGGIQYLYDDAYDSHHCEFASPVSRTVHEEIEIEDVTYEGRAISSKNNDMLIMFACARAIAEIKTRDAHIALYENEIIIMTTNNILRYDGLRLA
jgi:hypothetical protein